MKEEYRIGTGASSLMMIFVIITLTALGVLSLTTATADWRLAGKSAEMTEAWYQAAAQAQEALAELDAHCASGGALADFDTELGDADALDDETLVLTFDAGAQRALTVTVVSDASAQSPYFSVVGHVLSSDAAWDEDETLEVFH